MNTTLSNEQIENNWKYLKTLLLSTKREGIENLIEYLESTDFKLSPASTFHHHAYIGGLVAHTIEVYKNSIELNKAMKFKITDNQLIIAAILHDLCKANTYDVEKRNVKENGTWKEVDYFKFNDKWPIGHASKSVIVAQMFIKLDDMEVSLMIGHMAEFAGDPELYSKLSEKYPEIILLHTADMLSSKGVKIYE